MHRVACVFSFFFVFIIILEYVSISSFVACTQKYKRKNRTLCLGVREYIPVTHIMLVDVVMIMKIVLLLLYKSYIL